MEQYAFCFISESIEGTELRGIYKLMFVWTKGFPPSGIKMLVRKNRMAGRTSFGGGVERNQAK